MDLNSITSIQRPRCLEDFAGYAEGDAILAGGTWLFSEPQPHLRRLIDLAALDWQPLSVTAQGLSIAATCTIATLDAFEPPVGWTAANLIGQCCRAFLASFKIWNAATVGGNLCMGLPAGPMISLAAALEGSCLLWARDGTERRVSVTEFVRGPLSNALRPGELLRSIDIPTAALALRSAFRRATLTPLGRSGVLVIGTRSDDGRFALTVTAATRRPVRLAFDRLPDRALLQQQLLSMIPDSLYYDDMHGTPDWRRHMTFEFAEEIRQELAGSAA
jgi:CO/xanthine dehydrogenase FAD-binding subunit